MTVREKFQQMLIERGMFDTQANEVMDLAIPEIQSMFDDYQITFNSPADQYPSMIYGLIFLAIKPIALKWIEENKPMAWFKPMFE